MAHALDADQLVLEGLRDGGLDHLGRGARVDGRHRDDRLVDVGQLAVRDLRERDARRTARSRGTSRWRAPAGRCRARRSSRGPAARPLGRPRSPSSRRPGACRRPSPARTRCPSFTLWMPAATTTSPGARPFAISTRALLAQPDLDRHAVRAGLGVDLPDEGALEVVDERRVGHQQRVVAARDLRLDLGEEPRAQPPVRVRHPRLHEDAPALGLEGRRDEVDLAREALVRIGRDLDLDRDARAAPRRPPAPAGRRAAGAGRSRRPASARSRASRGRRARPRARPSGRRRARAPACARARRATPRRAPAPPPSSACARSSCAADETSWRFSVAVRL